MVLTKGQEKAIKVAIDRYKDGEKYTVIAGPAGCGKSSIVRLIIDSLNLPQEQVAYLAFSGKASTVLRQKGCPNAMTAHKFLYRARQAPSGYYYFRPKSPKEIGSIKVVVIDEVSMFSKTMWDLLCQLPVYILALGDPEQLGPVTKKHDDTLNLLDNPHVFMDEIVRQAKENEIIRIATYVREGNSIETYKGDQKNVLILPKEEVNGSVLTWGDQNLCATNRLKTTINNQMRAILKYSSDSLFIGDKLVNVHNQWDILSTEENPLTNGVISNVLDAQPIKKKYHPIGKTVEGYIVDISGDEPGEEYNHLYIDKNELFTGTPTLTPQEEYKITHSFKSRIALPLHFNFGYALTVWKAQGSQWDKVTLFVENSWPVDPVMRKQFLYTGITRAAEKLVIVV